jgi:threonine aldolase
VSRAISVEQTTNLGGGACWSKAEVDAVVAAARAAGLVTHMDGARLLNAAVATGTPAADFAAGFDSVWIDLSKGLGAPVGAVLAGSQEFIKSAWLWKQRLGGAMRQTGILAAAGLYALDHHVDRLAEDHANARRFAEGIADVPGLTLDPAELRTNIVVFAVRGDAGAFVRRLLEDGVRLTVVSNGMVRAVTHLDVDRAGIERAIQAVRTAAPA